jgi:hypothetical protein
MVSKAKGSLPARPTDGASSLRIGAGPEARAARRQLSRLFGESVLGAWPELDQKLGSLPPSVRRRRRWGRSVWVALAMLGVAAALAWPKRPGLNRGNSGQRGDYAQDLAAFIGDGELERASEYVALLRGESGALDPGDPNLDQVIRAEAAIYRYLDADPARLARIRPWLASSPANASPERLIASLAVLSREERADKRPWLVGLRTALHGDPEFHYLLATAETARGDLQAAREAWQRSAELGPAWLGHRFEQAEFERGRGDETAARKIVGQMLRVDPDSAWSRLAASELGVQVAPIASNSDGGRVPRGPSPVEVYHDELLGALHATLASDLPAARRHVGAALAAVHGEAPFVLDAFDWLLDAELVALAQELTRLPAWPQDSEVACRKTLRLSARVPPSEGVP